jgi:hypothetical protein
LYIPAQLRIMQSLFEGREGIVVAAADRIMITGYNFCVRLDGFFQDMHPARTLSLDSVVYRAGCESVPIGYNCRLGLELGLAALLMSGAGFVVQWHCLVLRGGGCSRPAIVLLGTCALRSGTKIGWEPEIHMAHINGSHGENLVS